MINLPAIAKPRWRLHFSLGLCVLVILSSLLGAITPGSIAFAAGTISGTVFRDLNANGLFENVSERGISNITVTAYDAAGTNQGSATTTSNGTYSLSASGVGPYRIEFTNLPAGLKPGPMGSQSGTTVQFVADNNASNVNVGLYNPREYCESNPQVAVNCFVAGDPLQAPPAGLSATSAGAALVTFPYHAAGETLQNTTLATAADIGAATWGLAYQRTAKMLFVAAVQRRHSGYGALGTGGIYAVNRAGATPVITNFANLNGLAGINTGANPHAGLPGCRQDDAACRSIDAASFDAVGKVSFGDIELSEDEQTLWAVNLYQRTLLEIKLGVPPYPPTAADITVHELLGHGTPTCTKGQFRPWGLKAHNGLLYVGGVCSAENKGTTADLRAYVLAFDPSNAAAGFSTVVNFSLDYAKGCAWRQGQPDAHGCQWNPWLATWPAAFPAQGGDFNSWPQPILSDIEFDLDGSLILGFADRWFLQGGSPQPPANATDPNAHIIHAINAGDILRVCFANGAFGLPGSAGCPNKRNNSQGPNGGEYYYEDNSPTGFTGTGENSAGGLAFLPGSGEVATTAIEPFDSSDDAGIIWHNNTTGGRNRGYTVYHSSELGGKALGMGDIELLCDAAPIEIGNRVWRDSNDNGIQDPGEPGLDGVTIELYRENVKVGMTTTANNGQYYFNQNNVKLNGANGIVPATGTTGGNSAYSIRIVNAVGASQQTPLAGLHLTEANDAMPSPSGSSQNDSNGVLNNTEAVYSIPYSDLLSPGDNNHTYDFGFAPQVLVNLGNRVWHDANNNGIQESDERGIDGVEVRLYKADIDPANAAPVLTTTTTNNGFYTFTNLLPGNYFVYLPQPPSQYSHSSDLTNVHDDGQDNDDNGTQAGGNGVAPGAVTSPIIDLAAGTEPDSGVDGDDWDGDLTVDFGFYGPVQVGDFVWHDVNHNGQQDAGEPGIPGVRVTLYTSTGVAVTHDADGNPISPQTTDNNGKYHFANLPPGNYYVIFDHQTVPAGSMMTTPNAPGVAADLNSDGDAVSGQTAPTGFLASNAEDLTLDLGLFLPVLPQTVSVGDYVWDDLNANGLQDKDEPGLANVRVTLFKSNGATTGLTTQTNAQGFYLFNNLPPDSYAVVFDLKSLPAGYVVTPQNVGTDNAHDSDADRITGQTEATGLLLAGEQNLTLDLGAFQPASLGDYVWLDENSNGRQDPGEKAVADVTATLFDAQNKQVATTMTDADGLYRFSSLRPGSYYVVFTLPAAYAFTLPNQGNDPTRDSDAAQPTGRTAVTALVSGENDWTWDAGLIHTITPFNSAALGGHTWDDGFAEQADGSRTVGEALLGGITAILLDGEGKEISRTLTAADGAYLFDNLPPGNYRVTFNLPPGFSAFTISHQGDNNSDANQVTGQTDVIKLVAGQRDLTWDSGFVTQPTSINGETEPQTRSTIFLPLVTK